MADRVLEAFLTRQRDEGLTLAAQSDLLALLPVGQSADRYLVEFRCTGLVEQSPGKVVEANRFHVGVRFPSTYLRTAHPFQVLSWLGPSNVWHPNISPTEPLICIGRLAPGTGLVDILYQVFEVITYNKVTMREDDALNPAACQWARRHRERFPIDRRPLKRRIEALVTNELSMPKEADGQPA
jgi:hypothetical protein